MRYFIYLLLVVIIILSVNTQLDLQRVLLQKEFESIQIQSQLHTCRDSLLVEKSTSQFFQNKFLKEKFTKQKLIKEVQKIIF